MTTVLFVRHAEHALQDRVLVGRSDGVRLSRRGAVQLRLLAEMLAREPVTAVQSSPRLRALLTARAIAERHLLPVESVAALDEIDCGRWTGMSFSELSHDPEWHAWNTRRSECCPPGGESMVGLQQRVLAHLEHLRDAHPGETVVLVSHAEPIRAALLAYAELGLDSFTEISVPPGGITRLHLLPFAMSGAAYSEALSP